MYALTVSDLSLSFGTTPVLEKVSFALDENDRLGIIGVNGCGKSTLFRLIMGEIEPTEGSVFLSKGKTQPIKVLHIPNHLEYMGTYRGSLN